MLLSGDKWTNSYTPLMYLQNRTITNYNYKENLYTATYSAREQKKLGLKYNKNTKYESRVYKATITYRITLLHAVSTHKQWSTSTLGSTEGRVFTDFIPPLYTVLFYVLLCVTLLSTPGQHCRAALYKFIL